MLDFGSIMIGSMQPDILVNFYRKVFDRAPDMVDGGYTGWKVGQTFLSIGEHSEAHGQAKDPSHIMLNFETSDVKGEFERIKKIGAKVIQEPYELSGAWIATLADPDGNYFQLMPPWDENMGK